MLVNGLSTFNQKQTATLDHQLNAQESAPYLIALTRKNLSPCRHCQRPRLTFPARAGNPIKVACGRLRCSHECRDKWAKKTAACLRLSFRKLPPTHEIRVTVLAVIGDQRLSLAYGRFLLRLKYRLGKIGSRWAYFLMNEWSDGHRHVHILVWVDVDITKQMIRELWAKTLPGVRFTCHCEPVRSPAAIARYVVKHIKDHSKKELPPGTFEGRIFTYSRHFFTKPVAELWKEQIREWFSAEALPIG